METKLSSRRRLADELRAIRQEARLNQSELATLAGVSRQTVKLTESEQTAPKAVTLRMLADGAATDGAGRLDRAKAAEFYERLMRAAGYIQDRAGGGERPRPVDDLTDDEVVDELERRIGDREVAVSFLATANDWRDLPPRAKRLILDVIREVRGEDDEASPVARRRR